MEQADDALLRIRDLSVAYVYEGRHLDAVRSVSLEIDENETVGIVGESGCGKSTLALAVMGHLGPRGRVLDGEIHFKGDNLLHKSRHELEGIRGREIAMVPQDPQSALNPSIVVGEQVCEVLRRHLRMSRAEAWDRMLELLEDIRMPDAADVARRYPHQLSGGMQQRALLCMSIACNPDLLLMDEPTTGLDVTTEARVLDLVNELGSRYKAGILYITHDLGVVARICSRVAVMYAGQIVETAGVEDIFDRPMHPYTGALLECIPRVDTSGRSREKLIPIKGQVPPLDQLPSGCAFQPRCEYAQDTCQRIRPELEEVRPGHWAACHSSAAVRVRRAVEVRAADAIDKELRLRDSKPLLSVRGLRKYFGERQRKYVVAGPLVGGQVHAVDDLDFEVMKGKTLSLVGESGCGKTTTGRCIAGLTKPTSGQVYLRDMDVTGTSSDRPSEAKHAIQFVFQNPMSALNPRHSVGHIVGRPLQLYRKLRGGDLQGEVAALLRSVRLDESYMSRYPGQLSGGERQRVAIARALAGSPELVVCDEIVSGLDVSVQAAILNLLASLQREQRCSLVFISHSLVVVGHISDHIGAMYLGRFVETGSVEQIFMPPYHPYTEALLSSIPIPDPHIRQKGIRLEGAVPSAMNPPSGCRFHTRCHRKIGSICEAQPPPWQQADEGHLICCHIPVSELETVEPVLQYSKT